MRKAHQSLLYRNEEAQQHSLVIEFGSRENIDTLWKNILRSKAIGLLLAALLIASLVLPAIPIAVVHANPNTFGLNSGDSTWREM
jgi:hypothetical protein